jgi:hypothetical protein
VQGHGTLVGFPGVYNPVHRFPRIDGAWVLRRQLNLIGCLEMTFTSLNIFKSNAKILDDQLPDGGCHPAILVAMIVY